MIWLFETYYRLPKKERTCWFLRIVLVSIMAVASLILIVRAEVGPFQALGIKVRSPLTAESLFAVSALFLSILSVDKYPLNADGLSPIDRLSRLTLLGVLVFVFLMFVSALHNPFLSDDYILVTRSSPHALSLVPLYFRTAGGDGSFRPLGAAWFDVLKGWAGLSSFKWHLSGLAIHVVNCLLVFLLTWSLWHKSFISATSSILFGIHGTRPEAVSWTAGMFDLLACCFLLIALIILVRFEHASWWGSVSGSIFFLCALLSKESAYAFPFILLGILIASGRRRGRSLWHPLIPVVVLSIAMFAYRWILFGGPGGYLDPSTGRPIVFSLRMASVSKAIFARLWVQLLFPLNWDSHGTQTLLVTSVLLLSITFISLAAKHNLGWKITSCLSSATIGALLPAIHLSLIGENALGSRVLYLPSLTFCILIACMLDSIRFRSKRVGMT